MSELLFKDDVLESKDFPAPYHPNFLNDGEADALFNKFKDFSFCQTQTRFGNDVRRRGVNYCSQPDHIQVGYTIRAGSTIMVDDDGCVGPVLPLTEAPDEVLSLRQKLSHFSGRDVNYLSVQIYRNGDDRINWHRHSEDDALDTPVFIISTGAERQSRLRLIRDYAKRWSRSAEHGSLIVLPASFNDTHHHAVLPEKNKGVRISVNTKCLLPPAVWDCHAGKRYPGSLAPQLPAQTPAVYVGCRVLSQRDGSVLRDGSVYGNGRNPFAGHRPIIADNEPDFRKYAERRMRDSAFRAQAIAELRGKHLLCWCQQDGPNRAEFCHARVWLDIVNRPEYAPEVTA